MGAAVTPWTSREGSMKYQTWHCFGIDSFPEKATEKLAANINNALQIMDQQGYELVSVSPAGNCETSLPTSYGTIVGARYFSAVIVGRKLS
jgi:hypothetical protein